MSIIWRRNLGVGSVEYDIGDPNQNGLIFKWDENGFRKYQIKLIIAASTREDFETARDALLTALRVMPIRSKDLGWRGKYIIPNGSLGQIITETKKTPMIYPESVQIRDQEITAAYAVATFTRAL